MSAYDEAIKKLKSQLGEAFRRSKDAIDAALAKIGDQQFVSEATAAYFLGTTTKTLLRWRLATKKGKAYAGPPFVTGPGGRGFEYKMKELKKWVLVRPVIKSQDASTRATAREQRKAQVKQANTAALNTQMAERTLRSKFGDIMPANCVDDAMRMVRKHTGLIICFADLHPYSSDFLEEEFKAGATIEEMSIYQALFEENWLDAEVRKPWADIAEIMLKEGVSELEDAQRALKAKGSEIALSKLPPAQPAPTKGGRKTL